MNQADALLLDVKDVVVHFPASQSSLFDRTDRTVKAVNSMSLSLRLGETLGLVGESGSGKSSFGRAILRLGELTSGTVKFDGVEVARGTPSDVEWLRRETAMIFQDPYGALNPRMAVGDAVTEVLRIHRKVPTAKINDRMRELFDLVGLDTELAGRRPVELSGGQCQRVGVARALAIEPRLIVADECVAALDVSIQGQIINLLIDLRARMGLSMIFIAHDLAIVRRLCDRVAVMYLGRVVEEGPTDQVFTNPRHPYTISLIRAIPEIDPDKVLDEEPLAGEPPSPVILPSGCAFHPRCRMVQDRCRDSPPPSLRGEGEHRSACILPPPSTVSP
ncbi:MAG: ABC transporter ATP-binding protein [Alphaproteobacteria bacterium]|nr:ABC transporter ATP-binding protein [Alphaproteobacteria bacterium]